MVILKDKFSSYIPEELPKPESEKASTEKTSSEMSVNSSTSSDLSEKGELPIEPIDNLGDWEIIESNTHKKDGFDYQHMIQAIENTCDVINLLPKITKKISELTKKIVCKHFKFEFNQLIITSYSLDRSAGLIYQDLISLKEGLRFYVRHRIVPNQTLFTRNKSYAIYLFNSILKNVLEALNILNKIKNQHSEDDGLSGVIEDIINIEFELNQIKGVLERDIGDLKPLIGLYIEKTRNWGEKLIVNKTTKRVNQTQRLSYFFKLLLLFTIFVLFIMMILHLIMDFNYSILRKH